MTRQFPAPAVDAGEDIEERVRKNAEAIGLLFSGKSNNVLDVTLTASATSTTVTDRRIGYCSACLLAPTTANAAAALATTYVSETGRVNGEVTITHANNSQTDRTFKLILVG